MDPVSQELADRVYDAVRELGYRPNRVARRLRRPGHEAWALIVPDVENRFFTGIARGVEAVASDEGIAVFIGNTDGEPRRLQRYLETAIAEQVAGVILAPSTPGDDVSAVMDANIPIVTVDQELAERPLTTIMTDHFEGGRLAAEALRSHSSTRVGVIAGPSDEPTWNTRLEGLDANLGDAIQRIERGDNRSEGGRTATARLLENVPELDAIFVTNNLMTIGALREIYTRGLRVPEDMLVVGYDLKNEEWVNEIPVISINQSPHRIGREAAQELLAESSALATKPRLVLLKPKLNEWKHGRS